MPGRLVRMMLATHNLSPNRQKIKKKCVGGHNEHGGAAQKT
jgi:hypothetical protein